MVVGGGFLVVRALLGADSLSGPECVVQPDPTIPTPATTTVSLADSADATTPFTSSDALSLDAVQLQYASTINAVGLRRQMPDRGRVIALATAMQESSLRNVTSGDRDSVGLFQQRPSQGWGTAAQILDPVYASNAFYDALTDVPDWSTLPLTEAAQTVQQSAYPDAYAKWEGAGTTLMAALSREWYRAVSCRAGAAAPTTEPPNRAVVPGSETADRALQDLLSAAQAELGGLTVVDVADGGQAAAVSVDVAGLSGTQSAAVLSAWVVAHATAGSVTSVGVSSYLWSDHRWAAGDAALPDGQVTVDRAAATAGGSA